jgi:hypothetical protein
LDAILGGWQITGIFRAQSGQPFDVRKNGVRVDLIGDPYTGSTSGPYLNRAAFREAPTGRFGTLKRNGLRSPSTYQFNLGVTKNSGFMKISNYNSAQSSLTFSTLHN